VCVCVCDRILWISTESDSLISRVCVCVSVCVGV